jgi:hypothetical protein
VFKVGDTVFHVWSHPEVRPAVVTPYIVGLLKLEGPGVLIGVDETLQLPSGKRYWRVDRGGHIIEWREDLLVLAS